MGSGPSGNRPQSRLDTSGLSLSNNLSKYLKHQLSRAFDQSARKRRVTNFLIIINNTSGRGIA